MEPSGPEGIRTLDEFARRLLDLRAKSGQSYRTIHRAIVRSRKARGIPEVPSFSTVHRCFQPGRSRLDIDLIADIVAVVTADEAETERWRHSCLALAREAVDATLVTVLDRLPAEIPAFTGRSAEIAGVMSGLDQHTCCVIDGLAGVGKTSLAVHVAHRLSERTRYDTVLAVNLRGFDEQREPADAAAVLGGMLRQAGARPAEIHRLDLAARVRAWRAATRDQRVLLLLDNAATADQVEPLLPGSPSSAVLVTSRRHLPAVRGDRLTLRPLSPAETVRLLRRTIGPNRVAREPDAAAAIAELSGGLPLAIATIAGQIRSRPDWTLTDHRHRVQARRDNLLLDDGVQPALGGSYDALGEGARQLLRMAALHPGEDFDAFSMAAIAGLPLPAARSAIDELTASHLLQRRGPDRYGLHDLVRVFGVGKARDEVPHSARTAALGRLLDYYLYATWRAAEQFAPHSDHGAAELPDGRVPDPGLPFQPPAGRVEAQAWLTAERYSLLRMARWASRHGHGRQVCQLSAMLWYFLRMTAHVGDAVMLHQTAVEVAPDDLSRCYALARLGGAKWNIGGYREARTHYLDLLELAEPIGERRLAHLIRTDLAMAMYRLGDPSGAVDQYRRALYSDHPDIGTALLSTRYGGLGRALIRTGELDEATDALHTALDLACTDGPESCEQAYALSNLALVYDARGLRYVAEDYALRALAMSRTLEFRVGEIDALAYLGRIRTRAGEPDEGVRLASTALTLARQADNIHMQIEIGNDLGTALSAVGQPRAAAEAFRRALTMAADSDDPYEQQRARDGLAGLSAQPG